ncbi:ATP-dependent Clp protease proteolytic subunit [Occultella glacieicola]|uniref:ATP-dependent Clp protease proteolytic subunit n=1 Tax=Occultella glacieicola TaxID=2518684 RepID=A0ABY2DZM3_9MICO|nr:ATP-dependent Clp protease proteolytic subunit [Occultella glacieicola]TDE90336.1 ATP-dependent Clp protease proteolytic subunit [Occultella glacieicola]
MSQYTIPSVIERTTSGERAADVYSRLLSDRIVFLGTEIDDGVANTIIAQLIHLESVDPDGEINLYINSPGGSVTAMLAIYDTMQFVRAPVATICVGQAASSAAVLLAAGEPGRRGALPHARVLLHPPSMGGQGALPDLRIQAAEIARMRAEVDEILARHTGQDAARLSEDTSRDRIFTASQAVDYHLVDEVVAIRTRATASR